MQKNIRKWKKKNKYWLLAALFLAAMMMAGCGNEALAQAAARVGQLLPAEEVQSVSEGRYAYETLTDKQQVVYDQMVRAIFQMDAQVRLATLDEVEAQRCYEAICADYGEIFWVEHCAYSKRLLFDVPYALSFLITYSCTPEERLAYQEQMQPRITAYLEALDACESAYEKTELLYQKLLQEVAYDLEAENNQTILSVFLGGKTVCQGYACAVQYLLQQAGVPCAIVTGTAHGTPHAWNLVELDGDYYYIDVTWGNFTYRETNALETISGINYAYLNITSDELLRTHAPGVRFPLPECVSTQDNYYRKQALYFSAWDEQAVGSVLVEAFRRGEPQISMKFADEKLLEQACTYLIDERHFADYYQESGQVYYIQDTELYILTLRFVA